MPWWDKPPSIAGKGFSTVFLALTVALLIVAAVQHYREPYRRPEDAARIRRWAPAPLTIAAAFVRDFEVCRWSRARLRRTRRTPSRLELRCAHR